MLEAIKQETTVQAHRWRAGEFAKTVCATCEAGWCRLVAAPTGLTTTIICKLDSETVNPMLQACDNYAARDKIEAGA